MEQEIAGIFVFELAVHLTVNRTLVFLWVPIDCGAGCTSSWWLQRCSPVGVDCGRFRRGADLPLPDSNTNTVCVECASLSGHLCFHQSRQHCLHRTSHGLCTQRKVRTRSRLRCLQSAILALSAECAFRRGHLFCGPVSIPKCVFQSATPSRDRPWVLGLRKKSGRSHTSVEDDFEFAQFSELGLGLYCTWLVVPGRNTQEAQTMYLIKFITERGYSITTAVVCVLSSGAIALGCVRLE